MDCDEINPSLGMTFYLKNKKELHNFFEKIHSLKEQYKLPFSSLKN